MSLFLEILTNVTLPIIVLMALGWMVQSRLELDVRTLSRLLLNVILPCTLFHFLTSADLPLVDVLPTFWFTVVQFVFFSALGWGLAAICGVSRELRPLVGLAMSFANTGNFGLPVAQLAFPPDYLLHQTVIVSLHSVLIIPFGVLILAPQRGSVLESLVALSKSPMILAVLAGLIVKGFEIDLPKLVTHPISIVAGAYISIALFTLGAQLATTRFSISHGPVWLAVVLKMLIAPALTWLMLLMLGIDPGLKDLLIVAAAAPVGLLLAIFCVDYERAPETAGAMVLVSTVISPFLVSAWIWAVRLAG